VATPVPPSSSHFQAARRALVPLALIAALALPAAASGATAPKQPSGKGPGRGTLLQLPGRLGCIVDRARPGKTCGAARALNEPGPFMGSRAIALSPDGRNVYVASSESDAIAIFRRDPKRGTLKQSNGLAGCVAAKGEGGCAPAVGLDAPNSVAVSPDGRNVYATSRDSSTVTAFARIPRSGALIQLPGGCVSGPALPGCTVGRALLAPDVLVVSPDGRNVYAGSFFGNEIAVLNRDPGSGALTQPSGATGCVAETAAEGCGLGIALKSPEGMAISADGTSVYVATALSNALVSFARDPSTGALTQASDGSGCIVETALTGCTTGFQLAGANAVAISPNDESVYVTSLFSNSVTSLTRSTGSTPVTQKAGTAGCLIFLRAAGCSFGRALMSPEGIVVSPDGASVYAAAYSSDAIAVLNRSRSSGAVAQKPGRAGCVAPSVPGCSPGRMLRGVSSLALSPDGRYLYATAAESDAIDIFRRKAGAR
jgi:DNA-binding beta-propeller fold protein YncE